MIEISNTKLVYIFKLVKMMLVRPAKAEKR